MSGSLTTSCDNHFAGVGGHALFAVRQMLTFVGWFGAHLRPIAVVASVACGVFGPFATVAYAEPDLTGGTHDATRIVVAGMKIRVAPRLPGSKSGPTDTDAPSEATASTATPAATTLPKDSDVPAEAEAQASPREQPPSTAPALATAKDAPSKPSGRAAAKDGPKGLPEDDYYAKRAKGLLSEDKAAQGREQSLQAAYPGFNVVVCEAGCYGSTQKLVHFEPIRTAKSAGTSVVASVSSNGTSTPAANTDANPTATANASATGQLQPTASGIGGEAVAPPAQAATQRPRPDEIDCVAGCYGSSKARSYPAASRTAAVDAARAEIERIRMRRETVLDAPRIEADGSWMTTVAKSNAAATPNGRSKSKPGVRPAAGQRRAASPSGEWFKRINDDRTRTVR